MAGSGGELLPTEGNGGEAPIAEVKKKGCSLSSWSWCWRNGHHRMEAAWEQEVQPSKS